MCLSPQRNSAAVASHSWYENSIGMKRDRTLVDRVTQGCRTEQYASICNFGYQHWEPGPWNGVLECFRLGSMQRLLLLAIIHVTNSCIDLNLVT